MNQFMPGIGQPIDPAAMAKGQGLWSPDTLAQGLQLMRGQGATLGNQEGMQQAQAQQAESLAAMMEAYRSAQGDQQMAQELMRPEYAQNSGGLGALAMIAQTYAGQRMRKKADESASDYASRIFEEEQRQAAAQAGAAQAAKLAEEERSFGRQLTLEQEKGRIRNERKPDALRTLEAIASNPELAAADQARRAAGAPRTSITMPGEQPFAGKSYDDLRTWENQAGAARGAIAAVNDIRGIMSQIDGGRYEEALSYVQEFAPALLPRDAKNLVAARQAFAGAVQPLMAQNLEMMRGLGAMSENEFKAAMSSLPKFGQDKAATEFLLGLTERKSTPLIQRAEAAREFMDTNPEFGRTGFMRFNPSQYAPPVAPPSGGGIRIISQTPVGN